jgi:TolB-like protein
MTERQQRRLAAILAADIAGYSALMGADEARTVEDLKAHQAVVLPMVSEQGGRIIDTAGDGILAEFASVVNAVECALAIQEVMAVRNINVPVERRMQFRIGINLGDVIHDETRVYGDGVNIAARLESIADPGGICVSSVVHDQVRTRLPITFTDLGDQQLKNIAQSARVYRIEAQQVTAPKPTLTLPDKPSIAVLPFTNLSGDTSQDYFSDGITEDIITELSRFSELFVIARNSSFQYKGKSPDIRQVGRELGVHYVLEGSIRRAGERVRITAQLIDAKSGTHRWAERYDRELNDVFAVQDEVARTIVGVLAAHVNKAEAERTLLKPPSTWQAHDFYLRAANALQIFFSSYDLRDLYEPRRLSQCSLDIDPNYSRAYSMLSFTYIIAWLNSFDSDHLRSATLDRALQLAQRSVQLDATLPVAHACLGFVQIWRAQHAASLAEFEKAAALNPNFSDWRFMSALVYAGEPARAVEIGVAYMRLDPFYPPVAAAWLGFAHYALKDYTKAIPLLRECTSRAPNFRGGHSWLAAAYAMTGQLNEARAHAAEVLRIDPNYTINGKTRPTAPFKHPQHLQNLIDGLLEAGLPEK